jgi:hypothetical protein
MTFWIGIQIQGQENKEKMYRYFLFKFFFVLITEQEDIVQTAISLTFEVLL